MLRFFTVFFYRNSFYWWI